MPLGVLLCKKRFETVPFLKKGYYFRALFPEGYCFTAEKGRKQYPSEEGYHFNTPRGTFFLNNHVYETVPLRSLGHQNSTPKGTKLWTVK